MRVAAAHLRRNMRTVYGPVAVAEPRSEHERTHTFIDFLPYRTDAPERALDRLDELRAMQDPAPNFDGLAYSRCSWVAVSHDFLFEVDSRPDVNWSDLLR